MRTRQSLSVMAAAFVALGPVVSRADEVLSADRAVRLAGERNPELLSLAAEVEAADARLRGASLLARVNPELGASIGPRLTATGSQLQVEASLSQPLEVFGQRSARIDAARSQKAGAEARLKARRAELAAEIRQAFVHALAADQLVQLATENIALSRQTILGAQKRLELGDGSRFEVNAARVDAGRAARELNLAVRNAAGAKVGLRVLLALEPTLALRLEGSLEGAVKGGAIDPDELTQRALQANWELVGARRGVEASQAHQRLEDRQWLPRPRVGARYELDEGDHVVLGTLELELPLFNRNEVGRGVAAAQLTQSELTLRTAEQRVRQQVLLAIVRLTSAREATTAFEGDVIAAMEENQGLVGAAYQAGKIGLFEMLLIRRDAVEARRGYIEALEEQNTAEAELAKAVGAPDGRL